MKSCLIVAHLNWTTIISLISPVCSRLKSPGLLLLVWKWFQTSLTISEPLPVFLSISEKDVGGSELHRAFKMQAHREFIQYHNGIVCFVLSPFLNNF